MVEVLSLLSGLQPKFKTVNKIKVRYVHLFFKAYSFFGERKNCSQRPAYNSFRNANLIKINNPPLRHEIYIHCCHACFGLPCRLLINAVRVVVPEKKRGVNFFSLSGYEIRLKHNLKKAFAMSTLS